MVADLKLPAEDVGDEDDGLGSRLVRRFRDVTVETTDVIFAATGRAFVDGTRYAAFGHSCIGRHLDIGAAESYSNAS